MFLPYILALFTFIIYFSLGFFYCDTRESLRRRDRFSMREHTQQRINNFWRPCALSLSLSLSSVFFFFYYYYFYLFYFIYISSIHLFFPSISCYFLLLDSLILLCVRSSSIFLDCDQINSLWQSNMLLLLLLSWAHAQNETSDRRDRIFWL